MFILYDRKFWGHVFQTSEYSSSWTLKLFYFDCFKSPLQKSFLNAIA